MAPFFPSGSSRCSKALRWSEESDYSDDDYDCTPTPEPPASYANAVCRSSPAQVTLVTGSSDPSPTCADAERPVEATREVKAGWWQGRKRHRRRKRPRRAAGNDDRGGETVQRQEHDRIPVH